MGEPTRRSYAFGPFVLDTGRRQLFRDGAAVPLAPKLLETLLALIEHRHDVISKEQLLSRVWGDTAIEEGGLARNVSLLRRTLGETPDDHRYIVTVPSRGYRFVADVNEARDEPPRQPSQLEVEGTRPLVAARRMGATTVRRGPALGLLVIAGAATAAFLLSVSTPGPTPNSAPRLMRLTSTSGLSTDPALSPDGRLLAYASDRALSGNLDIWVQPVPGDTPTRITSAEGDEVEPSFSPDGSVIVFSGGEAGGIYTVGALGGVPRLIVRGARTRTPRFSPDGRSILYWVGQTAWVVIPGFPRPGATGTLAIVASSGGAPRPLAHEFASARYGVWSPDGGKVLFLGDLASDAGASLDWYVVGVEGGQPVRTGALEALRAARLDGAPIPAAWTADGVAFTTTDATTSNVWRLPVSPDSGRVAGSPTRLTFGSALERAASVSALGHIAFTSLVENVDVWRVPLDPGTGMANGLPERVTDDAARDRAMNVSANGRKLAFVSSRTGRDEVWLKDLATGAERQLTFIGSSVASMAPDGLRVAVDRLVGDHNAIDSYDSGGSGDPIRLCENCALSGGAWSEDGSRLLITRKRHALDRSVILEVASKHEIEVTSHAAWNIFQSHLSPDGRWVVFHTSNAPNLRQVHVVRASQRRPPRPASGWRSLRTSGFSRTGHPTAPACTISLCETDTCAHGSSGWSRPRASPTGAPEAVLHLHQPRLRAAVRATPSNDVVNGAMYVTLTETTGNIWMLEPTVSR